MESIDKFSPGEYKYVKEVMDYGFHNVTSPGISKRLEQEFAKKFNVGYAICHANGTVTMHSALAAANVGAGDEVIVPPLTMASTALVVIHANAIPVFADIDPETFTIDPEDIRRKITARTKAIIPVSIYGLAPDMDPIMDMAREHNLIVIEDDAQCFLGYYKGKIVGSIGDMASFSFQGSKHMTCGEGGILITSNKDLASRVRQFCCLGYAALSAEPGKSSVSEELRQDPSFARHEIFGYNYRLPEIAAAVALGQLEHLDELVAMRKECAGFYAEVVSTCNWLIPQRIPSDCVHAAWTYVVRLANDNVDWRAFRKKFVELGGDGFYGAWLPTYREPAFQKFNQEIHKYPEKWPQYQCPMSDYSSELCPVAEQIQPHLIQLKTHYTDLNRAKSEADILARAIASFS